MNARDAIAIEHYRRPMSTLRVAAWLVLCVWIGALIVRAL